MNYIQVKFAVKDKEKCEILTAQLSDIGYEGFEEQADSFVAYIPETGFDDTILKEIAEVAGVVFETDTVAEQNWNAIWEQSFEPVIVGDFCAIRAGFHTPIKNVKHEVIITPRMSFGTGHHATTQLMVTMMKDVVFKDKTILDFGTGTGVLAILAHKLGAKSITAIDNDEWSFDNIKENIVANDAKGIDALLGSLEVVTNKKYDVILANINRHILLQCMSEMKKLLLPGGYLMMSGILLEDKNIVVEEALKTGLQLINEACIESWLCLLFKCIT